MRLPCPASVTLLAALASAVAVAASPGGAQVRPRHRRGRAPPAPAIRTPRQPRRRRRHHEESRRVGRRRTRWRAALLARPGYTFTRYQGPIVTFDALTRAIDIFIGLGDTTGVAVQRGEELIVADTSIRYDEGSGRAVATGKVYIREGENELTGIGRRVQPARAGGDDSRRRRRRSRPRSRGGSPPTC